MCEPNFFSRSYDPVVAQSDVDAFYATPTTNTSLHSPMHTAIPASVQAHPRTPASIGPGMYVPDFDPNQFSGAFWTPDVHHNLDDGFEDLKRYLRQGNDFCKDVIEVLKER